MQRWGAPGPTHVRAGTEASDPDPGERLRGARPRASSHHAARMLHPIRSHRDPPSGRCRFRSEDGKITRGGPGGEIDGQHVVLVVYAASEDEARAVFADDPWTDSILRIESVEPWTLLDRRGRSPCAVRSLALGIGERSPSIAIGTCTHPGAGVSPPSAAVRLARDARFGDQLDPCVGLQ